ncbi:neuroglobin-like [Hydractinia symbiolongicarpus]|uniref:neuroglobin-like n=1 Tax=Hydractinia symbiolongicarpus TaxID=13093 RepID=UPI00254A3188|nr:neuroglobin-like [Hydractinia symbiolongicarpus]XP_057315010.1 neuroglobin-like [Hydractinia symbiolongicarpus]XP_057315011.1 neuroglobin-like [Hydractinia symbiolongicarpus]
MGNQFCLRRRNDIANADPVLQRKQLYTIEEINLLQKQWHFMMKDVDDNGIMLFTALFASNVNLMLKFPFASAYEYDNHKTCNDARLLFHVRRVFYVFDSVIDTLSNGRYTQEMSKVKDIGKIHSKYGVKLEDLQDFKTALLKTLSKELSHNYDEFACSVWSKFIDDIIHCIDSGTYADVHEKEIFDNTSTCHVHNITVLKQ